MFFLFSILPTLSFASIYSCNGDGFVVEISANPSSMKIIGNGFNSHVDNIRVVSTFDTTITGNISTPPATIKLIIKDSSFGNPGDSFKSLAQISSSSGIKDFVGLVCVRGND